RRPSTFSMAPATKSTTARATTGRPATSPSCITIACISTSTPARRSRRGLCERQKMAWDEARAWLSGTLNGNLYQNLLDDALARPARNARRKKIIHPEDMPWEMSRQGLLKHLLNEQMHTRMETVDAYVQVIPPGSRSGKHRHLAEECLYVVEGHGY